MQNIILHCNLCPGDIVTMTAAVRDLVAAHGDKYRVDVRTPHPDLWNNNPNITPIKDGDGWKVEMHYPLIGRSNQGQHHFIHGYRMHLESVLGRVIPSGDFRGDIHLTAAERKRPEGAPYWVIVSGGKADFTAKHWDAQRWQEVVDAFPEIRFIQVGESKDIHPPLRNVEDMRGRTTLRQLILLIQHSAGVLCPVTSLMHISAALPLEGGAIRPCVVVAGGREPSHWEAYPGHRFLDTIGQLPCCASGGCWKSRTVPLGDGDKKDESLCERPVNVREGVHIPACLARITSRHVIEAMRGYMLPAPPVVLREAAAPRKGCCGGDLVKVDPTDPKSWGPKFWRDWHARGRAKVIEAEPEAEFIERFTKSLPCEECREHFQATLAELPPVFTDAEAYRAWQIAVHNVVNKRLGKPVLSLEAAIKSIEGNRNAQHAHVAARAKVCRTCEFMRPATKDSGPMCLRDGEVRLNGGGGKVAVGDCDKWPGYVEPTVKESLSVAADVPATSFGNKVGVVIGTYGAVPYIHLQLESLRRFHPGTPVLVVDDCSPHFKELADLCWRYGAEFVCNPERMNHARGDMQAFIEGHEWARELGISLLVKLSRRWIPIAPWIDEAVELWERTAATTLCNISTAHGFGFRSECVAMDVTAWDAANACQVLRDHIKASAAQPGDLDVGASGMLVEHIVHVAAAAAKNVARWESELNFEPWPWMTTSRHGRIPGVLWHEGSPTSAYLEQLRAWGINDYTIESLLDAKANLHLNR